MLLEGVEPDGPAARELQSSRDSRSHRYSSSSAFDPGFTCIVPFTWIWYHPLSVKLGEPLFFSGYALRALLRACTSAEQWGVAVGTFESAIEPGHLPGKPPMAGRVQTMR